MGIFAGALIPIGAHAGENLGIVHLACYSNVYGYCFRRVTSAPLQDFEASAPDGCVVGVMGEHGSGVSKLLRLAAGLAAPEMGRVERSGAARWLGPQDALIGRGGDGRRAGVADRGDVAAHGLAQAKAAIELDGLRRAGKTALVARRRRAAAAPGR